MRLTCYQCNTETDILVPFQVQQFACPNCYSTYTATEKGDFTFLDKYKYEKSVGTLKPGQKGILKNEEYTVTGVIVKNYQHDFYWTEYVLTSAKGNYLYLSEANGHWIVLKEIPDDFVQKNFPKSIDYNDKSFRLYETTKPRIVAAAGFFDIELPNNQISMAEYVAPPYIISFERIGKERTAFFGEHISKRAIKRIFNVTADMPGSIGIGIVQPFFANVRQLALIMCSVTLLMLLTYLYVYQDKEEKIVFSDDISFSEYSGKEYISPSFTLEGGASPLSIMVRSDVDNSWANAQIALVNEKTNEEVYANKDIEYYHGNTDGESWSEGDQSDDFSICGVGAGKYHLAITVSKAPEDINNAGVRVTATWNNASLWNVGMLVIIMLVIVLAVYFGELLYETKRWSDSPYSPYE